MMIAFVSVLAALCVVSLSSGYIAATAVFYSSACIIFMLNEILKELKRIEKND